MLGYLLGGTSFGFLSFQAYRRRQEKKKTNAINEQVQENILSPYEWTEGEDVYSLQTQLLNQQMQATNVQEEIPKKRYFQRTRDILSKTFLQIRTNQLSLFYRSNNDQSNIQNTQTHNTNEQQQLIPSTENLVQQTIRTSSLNNIYKQFVNNYQRKNDEKQLQQVKKQIISPNLNKKEGSPQKNKNPSSPKSSSSQAQYFEFNDNSQKENSIISYIEGQQLSDQDSPKGIQIPINQFENNFNESTIGKKSILYTEYKGNQPNDALKEFLNKCENHLPIKNAMIIRYYFGKGDPSSYVLAVEYNPVENEGVPNTYHQIDGANLALLKKTDAFKFDYNFSQLNNQKGNCGPVQLSNWQSDSNQQELRNILEQEIESKIHIGGVRQMKYIEVFSLDEQKNITNYQVHVPYGQNESAYDLRSKSQASDIQYHNTFRQSDIYQEKN